MIDLDRLRMMRGVSMHEVYPGLVDQSVSERAVRRRDRIAPVAAPMNRRDNKDASLAGELCVPMRRAVARERSGNRLTPGVSACARQPRGTPLSMDAHA